jgi:hypothetical protein
VIAFGIYPKPLLDMVEPSVINLLEGIKTVAR